MKEQEEYAILSIDEFRKIEAAKKEALTEGSTTHAITIKKRGRPPLSPEEKELRALERATKIVERIPEIVCIRINANNPKLNLEDAHAVYERVRGAWKVGSRAFAARYVLAAVTGKYNGVITNKVVAVYDVQHWKNVNPAGYTTRSANDFVGCERRFEFDGIPTVNEELQKLVGKIFIPYRKLNGSNPISFKELATIADQVTDIPEKASTKSEEA